VTRAVHGPDGGLPAGYARVPADTTLLRGHDPRWPPNFFGPPVGRAGANRFDVPTRTAADPGTCYLALSLEGVLLERVVRDFPRPAYSTAALGRRHALAAAVPTRDLLLVDLVAAPTTVHGVQASQIVAPPLLDAATGRSRYPHTQALAARWAAARHPVDVDGILYGSRFGSRWLCLALWDRAAPALRWRASVALTHDTAALADAFNALGLGLAP
jgi:hypothetical protein